MCESALSGEVQMGKGEPIPVCLVCNRQQLVRGSGCDGNGVIRPGLMYSQAYISTCGSSASVAHCDRVD